MSTVYVRRSETRPIKMTTGGEKSHPIVIDRGYVKEWIGFGWINCGWADAEERAKYPKVIEDDEVIVTAVGV